MPCSKPSACFAQEHGLSGLEFASGIPGTLGGGCAMNAGAYGGQISDVLISARVLLDGEIRTLSRDEMQMGYRTTLPLRRGGVVLSARFHLAADDPEAIVARSRELNARRREKQPLNYPSAGSVFKRPEGHFAGALIEEAGLKGLTIGGIVANAETALAKKWPLSRELYLFTNGKPAGNTAKFMDFMLDPKLGQQDVLKAGYIPLGK